MSRRYLKHINKAICAVFVICLFLSIKWCDYPSPTWMPEIIAKLLEKPTYIDPIMSAIVTGYIASYIVFLLTVVLPTAVKNAPMRKNAAVRLGFIYRRNVYLLLLMYKNTSMKEQWEQVPVDDDLKCFDENFYERMRNFDVQARADSLLKKKDTQEPLSWLEYLSNQYEYMARMMDDIVREYQIYLPENILELIEEFRMSTYLNLFLGESSTIDIAYQGEDGYTYNEPIPIALVYIEERRNPIFAQTEIVDNADVLRDYISILKKLYSWIKKYPGVSVKQDYAISKLKRADTGHFGIAIFQ